jgi:hypothetical protein
VFKDQQVFRVLRDFKDDKESKDLQEFRVPKA